MKNLPNFDDGTVWIVGAGPGDPGLLTLLAAKGLSEADVVFRDELISDDILDWIRPEADVRLIGKRNGMRRFKQEDISKMLVDEAKLGKKVLRLKGGDPFVFGRGGEEALTLANAGVHFRIVPGVTAGIGGLGYAGIPVTHRTTNSVVSFVTGHASSGELPDNIDWMALAKSSPVIVFYMALTKLPLIVDTLMRHGHGADTPLAVVSKATISEQSIFKTTLGTCKADLEKRLTPLPSPAIIAVGETVNLHDELNQWMLQFDQKHIETNTTDTIKVGQI